MSCPNPACTVPGCQGVHAQAMLVIPATMMAILMPIENLFPVGFAFIVDPSNQQQVITLFKTREQAHEFVTLFKQALDAYDNGATQIVERPQN